MRIKLKDLMEKLGVDRELSPYETQPWMAYDEDKGITCEAEVRMGPADTDCEVEIQFLYDEPPEDLDDEDDDGKQEGGSGIASGSTSVSADLFDEKYEPPKKKKKKVPFKLSEIQYQMMYMRILAVNDGMWQPVAFRAKGKDYASDEADLGDWENRACALFSKATAALAMDKIPDIDDLIQKELSEYGGWGGGGKGKIGRKSPKIKPAAVMGMKQGGM